MYNYTALVTRILSGDTFEALVDLGFNVFLNMRFRLYGISCPPPKYPTKTRGIEAQARTGDLILNKRVKLGSIKYDKNGISLAEVMIDGFDLAERLVQEGFAVRYEEKS